MEKAVEYPYSFEEILKKNNGKYSFLAFLPASENLFVTESELALKNNSNITYPVLRSIAGMRRNHPADELSNTLNWKTLQNNSIVFESFILLKNKKGRIVVNTQSLYRAIKRYYYISQQKNLKLVVPLCSITSFFETKKEYLIIKNLLNSLSVIVV